MLEKCNYVLFVEQTDDEKLTLTISADRDFQTTEILNLIQTTEILLFTMAEVSNELIISEAL